MSAETTRPNRDAPIVLDAELTIYTAAETLARLRTELDGRTTCDLDLSAVSEMDSAGLQLLFWTQRTAEEQGASFRLIAHSEAVAGVLELLHLKQHFGLDPTTAMEDRAT